MSDNWDFYQLKVDDQPAFIFLDLEAQANGELLPEHMAYARVRMRDPRHDGLSSQSEFDTLISVENALERQAADTIPKPACTRIFSCPVPATANGSRTVACARRSGGTAINSLSLGTLTTGSTSLRPLAGMPTS